MRTPSPIGPLLLGLLLAVPLAAQSPGTPAETPRPFPVGTMSELMIHVLYPASDPLFYISSRTPETSEDWTQIQMKALTLAEAGNLLMLPGWARDTDQWVRDALLLREAGRAAFEAAKARDLDALIDLNDQLYQSCISCHLHYRPDYGRPRQR